MRPTTKEWLDLASLDLRTIERILHDSILAPVVAFHAQQAIEKSFKAVIEEHAQSTPRIHDLIRLYNQVQTFLPVHIDSQVLTDLSMLYMDTRYPSHVALLPSGTPTQSDAQRFAQTARETFDTITRSLHP